MASFCSRVCLLMTETQSWGGAGRAQGVPRAALGAPVPSPLTEITEQWPLGGLCGPGEQSAEEEGGSWLCHKENWAWAICGARSKREERWEGDRDRQTCRWADQLGARKTTVLWAPETVHTEGLGKGRDLCLEVGAAFP